MAQTIHPSVGNGIYSPEEQAAARIVAACIDPNYPGGIPERTTDLGYYNPLVDQLLDPYQDVELNTMIAAKRGEAYKPYEAASAAWAGLREYTGVTTPYARIGPLVDALLSKTQPELPQDVARMPVYDKAGYVYCPTHRTKRLIRTRNGAAWRCPEHMCFYWPGVGYAEPAAQSAPAVTEQPQEPAKPKLIHGDQMGVLLPPTEMLIPDMIPKGKLIENFGMGGSGKSTLNLDLALTVAQFANVVYVAGEDETEYVARKAAWHEHHKLGAAGFYFWPEPINLLTPDSIDAFLTEIHPIAPLLIVIDPLANCMAGYSDSDTRDMMIAVEGLNRIRKATGATVLVCHHTGWSDTHERGSSVLRWACRLVMKTQNNDGLVALSCEKVNGAKKFDTRFFRMVEVGGSIVPVPANKLSSRGMPLASTHISVLDALNLKIFEDGATFTQIIDHTEIKKSTLHGTISRLMELNAIMVKGEKQRRGAEYLLTEIGYGILSRHNQGLNPYFTQPLIDEERGLNWVVQMGVDSSTELQPETTELGANYEPNYQQGTELAPNYDSEDHNFDDSSSNVVRASSSLVRPLFGASSVLVHPSGSSSFAPPSLEGGDDEQPNEQTSSEVTATPNYLSLDWSFVMRMYALNDLPAIERHCVISRVDYAEVLAELQSPSKDDEDA